MKKSIKKMLPYVWVILCMIAGVICIFLMTKTKAGTKEQLVWQVLAVVFFALALICVAGDEKGSKLKKIFESFKDAIEEVIGKIIAKIAELFGMSGGRGYGDKRFLQGYEDVSIKVEKKQSKKKRFEKKYKDMDNRERIRFFYSKMMNKQIKKGYKFKWSKTPTEHERILLEYDKIEKDGTLLFDSYNEARYYKNAVITEENVENVKKICKKH